jgi:hypothetical protein
MKGLGLKLFEKPKPFTIETNGESILIPGAPDNILTRIKKANGGYIMPSYKTGTPYVPFDQVAYLHQGERVVPATQNNAKMGNTIYLTNNITAAPGMDTELLAMRVVDMTKKALAADVTVNASKIGIKREFGSKVMI